MILYEINDSTVLVAGERATAAGWNVRSGAVGSLSSTAKLSALALMGVSVTAAVVAERVYSVIGEVPPPVVVFGVLPLLGSSAIMVGWRWAPFLATAISAVMLVMTLPWLPKLMATPSDVLFAPFVVAVAAGIAAFAAGTTAGVQNYRRVSERGMPRWLWAKLAGVAGVVVGIFSMAGVPRPDSGTGISDEMLALLPALETEKFAFVQQELRVPVGETVMLRLENKDAATHSLDIDELDVHTVMPANGTAVTVFKAEQPGTYTFYCAPHYDKETGEGMKGVLIVEG